VTNSWPKRVIHACSRCGVDRGRHEDHREECPYSPLQKMLKPLPREVGPTGQLRLFQDDGTATREGALRVYHSIQRTMLRKMRENLFMYGTPYEPEPDEGPPEWAPEWLADTEISRPDS
jgi:hypothetical protein